MAALYTVATLTTEIATEARLGEDSSWTTAIMGLILETLIACIIRDKPNEFLKLEISQAATITVNTVPADFLFLQRLQYTSGTTTWELCDYEEPVCPAAIAGKPSAYSFARDTATGLIHQFRLYPVGAIADSVVLDYYFRPTITQSTDPIPYDKGIPVIREEILQRLQIMQNKPADELAKILQGYVMMARKELSDVN